MPEEKQGTKRTMTCWLVVKLTVEVDESKSDDELDLSNDYEVADTVGSNVDYNVTYASDEVKVVDTCIEGCKVDCPL